MAVCGSLVGLSRHISQQLGRLGVTNNEDDPDEKSLSNIVVAEI